MNNQLLSISQTARMLGVSIDTVRRWATAGRLPMVRSGTAGHRYFRQQDIDLFLKNPVALGRQWVQSSSGSEPDAVFYCKTRDIFQARLEHMQTILGRIIPIELVELLTAVAGEIGNNSFDHNLGNWPDVLGIFFAYDSTRRQIILADRGQGVLTTLRRTRSLLTTDAEALNVAFTEIVSGRAPEARGNGLKFVRSVMMNNPFTLQFQSGDAVLQLKQHDTKLTIHQSDTTIRGCFALIGFEETA